MPGRMGGKTRTVLSAYLYKVKHTVPTDLKCHTMSSAYCLRCIHCRASHDYLACLIDQLPARVQASPDFLLCGSAGIVLEGYALHRAGKEQGNALKSNLA